MFQEHSGGRRPRQEDESIRRKTQIGAEPPLLIIDQRRKGGAERKSASGRFRDHPFSRTAASEVAADMVDRCRRHRRARRNHGIVFDASPDDFAGVPEFGKLFLPYAEKIQHLRVISFCTDVIIKTRRHQSPAGCTAPGKLVDDIILDHQEFFRFRKELRFVFAEPQDLRRRPAGKHFSLPGQMEKRAGGELSLNDFRLAARPVVQPYNRFAERLVVRPRHDQRFRLSRNGHCTDFFRCDA